jgi:hypothetical protein
MIMAGTTLNCIGFFDSARDVIFRNDYRMPMIRTKILALVPLSKQSLSPVGGLFPGIGGASVEQLFIIDSSGNPTVATTAERLIKSIRFIVPGFM